MEFFSEKKKEAENEDESRELQIQGEAAELKTAIGWGSRRGKTGSGQTETSQVRLLLCMKMNRDLVSHLSDTKTGIVSSAFDLHDPTHCSRAVKILEALCKWGCCLKMLILWVRACALVQGQVQVKLRTRKSWGVNSSEASQKAATTQVNAFGHLLFNEHAFAQTLLSNNIYSYKIYHRHNAWRYPGWF